MQGVQASEESSEVERKRRFRRAVVLLLLAIALLLLGLLLFAMATPPWQADGSRPAYSALAIAAICACLASGTVLVPVSLRELVLALLPSKALGLVLGLAIGLAALIAVPLEIWLVMIVTDALEPGSEQRYEEDTDWDWD